MTRAGWRTCSCAGVTAGTAPSPPCPPESPGAWPPPPTPPGRLALLFLRGGNGGLVPLQRIPRMETGLLPVADNHQGQFASTTLSFTLAPGVAIGPATDRIERVKKALGMPPGVRAGFYG